MSIKREWIWLGLLAVAAQGECVPGKVFQQVDKELGQHLYEKAGQLLDGLNSCGSLSAMELFQRGWLYGRAHRFDNALEILSSVPRDVPDRATHDYAVALSKFELADYAGASGVLEELRKSGSLDAKASNLLAVSYSKAGQLQNAYAVLTEEVRVRTELTTYLNMVTVCADGGDYTKAAEAAKKGAALFPQSADVWIALGAADSLLGRLEQAGKEFGSAVTLAPQRADARFFWALTAYNQGQYTEAIAALRKAKREAVEDSDLLYLLAECYLKTAPQNPGPPLAVLNEAVKVNPDSVAARTLRGRLLLEKRQVNEALTDLEFANRREPNSRTAIYNLARAYQAVGKPEQAAALFRKLRSAKPDAVAELGNERLRETLQTNP